MGPHSRRTIDNEVLMDSDYDVDVIYTDDPGESPYEEGQE